MTTELLQKERDTAIDIMKGILIISVIVGHMTEMPNGLHSLIYSFHMPAFFILAGCFFKIDSVRSVVVKSFRRLLLPYVFVCGVLLLYTGAVFAVTKSFHTGVIYAFAYPVAIHEETPTLVIWFLAALFFARICYDIIWGARFHVILKWIVAISISALPLLISKYLDMPLAFLQGMSAVIFIALGKPFLNVVRSKYWYLLMLTLGVGILLLIPLYSIDMATIAYVNWPIAVVGTMSSTCVLYYIARGFEYIPIFSRMLIWFGKYSLVVICVLIPLRDLYLFGLP